MLGVFFGSVFVMLGRVQRMSVRDFGVVRGFFVMPGLVVLCCFAVVLRRLVVVMGGLLVMLVNVVFHSPSPRLEGEAPLQAIMKHLRPAYCRRKIRGQGALAF